MRTWIFVLLELAVVIVLEIVGQHDVALGLVCGGSLAMTVFLWPGRDVS